jgi:hypothetical protein
MEQITEKPLYTTKRDQTPDGRENRMKIAVRFKQFRIKFIHQRQEAAGRILSLAGGHLNQIEVGNRPVSVRMMIDFMNRYNLNSNWLLMGEGNMLSNQRLAETEIELLAQSIESLNKIVRTQKELIYIDNYKLVEQEANKGI